MEKRLLTKISELGTTAPSEILCMRGSSTRVDTILRFTGQNDRETNISYYASHIHPTQGIDNIMSTGLASVPGEAKGLFVHLNVSASRLVGRVADLERRFNVED